MTMYDRTPPVVFGAYRLFPDERRLVRDGEAVRLGGRALDILLALVARAGDVVSHQDLAARVWPGVVVTESSLRVHITGLRKALGDGLGGVRYITNVAGRGYCFVHPLGTPPSPPSPGRLPPRLRRITGRDETIDALCAQLKAHRFVTVIGPGGIGKTTVAVAAAHRLMADFEGAVAFIDLGSLMDPELAAGTVAAEFGLVVNAAAAAQSLVSFLRDKRVLLVLDNCEHLIGAVAALAEILFYDAPGVALLTTSREALRVEGEIVHRLGPLQAPPEGEDLSLAQIETYPAVQLFLERAAAGGGGGGLSTEEGTIVAGICQRLDGIALAIELAAGLVGAYGVRGTATLLENRLRLLNQPGKRTAPARQQSLSDLVDWSYNLLSEDKRKVLRRLAVFAGPFTLDAAVTVAGDETLDGAQIDILLTGLVGKSLVQATSEDGLSLYRMLETTRSYGLEKLADEHAEVARRHAQYFTDIFEARRQAAADLFYGEAPASSFHLANVRAALSWAYSSGGCAEIGMRLTAASAELFLGLALLVECHQRVERALERLADPHRRTARELDLKEALAISSMFTRGNSQAVLSAILDGLELAEFLGDRSRELRLLAGLNMFCTRTAQFVDSLAVAERARRLAHQQADPSAMVMTEWMVGVSHHLSGHQAEAEAHITTGFALADDLPRRDFDLFGYDHRVRALIALPRALWLRGRPDRAAAVARQAIAEADRRRNPINVCISLIYTPAVFMWREEWAEAGVVIERLIAYAERHSLRPYHAVGLALRGELMIRNGEDAMAGCDVLRDAIAVLKAENHNILTAMFTGALSFGYARTGRLDEAIALVDAALADATRNGDSFEQADLLRLKGEYLQSTGGDDWGEASFRAAIACADRQGAVAWSLAAALPLADGLVAAGRGAQARAVLESAVAGMADAEPSRPLAQARARLAGGLA